MNEENTFCRRIIMKEKEGKNHSTLTLKLLNMSWSGNHIMVTSTYEDA